MDALEKAKKSLRKYILENKDKVSSDLKEMREKSDGDSDIHSYIDTLSKSTYIGEINTKGFKL
jgi:hypothetical protein